MVAVGSPLIGMSVLADSGMSGRGRWPLGKMADLTKSHERYPVHQAQQVITDRLSGGSSVLGIEGLWVRGNEVRPDLDYIADFSPDGLTDLAAIT